MLFVLNRLTGEPLYPIEEVAVAASDIVGEAASKTQPVPSFYPPFSRTNIKSEDLATRSAEAKIYAESMLNTIRYGNPFIPLSEQGTMVFPGLDGGGEWGGASFDPKAANLITNSSEMPWNLVLDKVMPATPGERIYSSYCQSCHGANFEGGQLFGNVPALKQLSDRLSLPDVVKIVHIGKGVMPAFGGLSEERITSIYNYINGTETAERSIGNTDWPYPYRMRGYNKLVAPDGYPIIDPPWGQLTSINMNSGKINWQVPLGEEKAFLPEITGTESYGGPVATAGGLVFIAGTKDEKIRAFDKETGEILWQYQLPAAGYATPAIYQYDGRQYVVIACGGGKLGTPSGDNYVAFAFE
jgi:quinoprotein glucose dehydrogenase